ncbi:hypothetical protein WDW37_00730 [Bdellovibrionota bacterium FG-1]
MAARRKPKERLPERMNPGDPEPESCSPGSIEQELDMCEEGSLRGDDILHSHGKLPPEYSETPRDLSQMIDESWRMDLSEENREGDEMTGDEHSSGMAGGETEIEGQAHISTGLPGDRTQHEKQESRLLDKPEGTDES